MINLKPSTNCFPIRKLKFNLRIDRGNSKYHYYGIRLKPDSLLNNLSVNEDSGNYTSRTTNGSSCQTQKRFRNSKPEPSDTHYNTTDQNNTQSTTYQTEASPEVPKTY